MKEEILTKKKWVAFLRVIETLGSESSKVVIFFNNSGSSSLSSLVDVGFRPNHVNRRVVCMFLFSFPYSFPPIIILCHGFSQRSTWNFPIMLKFSSVNNLLHKRVKMVEPQGEKRSLGSMSCGFSKSGFWAPRRSMQKNPSHWWYP